MGHGTAAPKPTQAHTAWEHPLSPKPAAPAADCAAATEGAPRHTRPAQAQHSSFLAPPNAALGAIPAPPFLGLASLHVNPDPAATHACFLTSLSAVSRISISKG